MKVVITDVATAARQAADVIAEALRGRPDPVLGLATGSTPLPLYDELARRHREEGLSFAHAQAFTLDEYVGLPTSHPERYRTVIERDLTSRVDLRPDAIHSPDDTAEDLDAACAAYEAHIARAGGIDVQILGIGSDGHIAFNMPGSPASSRTRMTTLTEQTRADNARFFDGAVDAVPPRALTQGLATIMGAGHLLMLATGEAKAAAVAQLVEGPVSDRWPATILQRHPRVTVLLDEAAASGLALVHA